MRVSLPHHRVQGRHVRQHTSHVTDDLAYNLSKRLWVQTPRCFKGDSQTSRSVQRHHFLFRAPHLLASSTPEEGRSQSPRTSTSRRRDRGRVLAWIADRDSLRMGLCESGAIALD